MSVTAIMRRIEVAKADLARAEGQQEVVEAEIESTVEKLRDLLGCKPGKEKAAMKALRAKLTEQEEELEAILDEIEAAKDGEEDDA